RFCICGRSRSETFEQDGMLSAPTALSAQPRRRHDATPPTARTLPRNHRGHLLVPGGRRAARAGLRPHAPAVDHAGHRVAHRTVVHARGAADAPGRGGRPVRLPGVARGPGADPGTALPARLPPERARQPQGRGPTAAGAGRAGCQSHPGRIGGSRRPGRRVPGAGRRRPAASGAGAVDRVVLQLPQHRHLPPRGVHTADGPLATLALLSLGVLALGIILVVGEFLLLVTASLLAFALWAAERPVAQLLTEQFVTPAQDDGTDAAAAEPRPEG